MFEAAVGWMMAYVCMNQCKCHKTLQLYCPSLSLTFLKCRHACSMIGWMQLPAGDDAEDFHHALAMHGHIHQPATLVIALKI